LTILGIDHGERRIGVAISDSTASLVRPLRVLVHTSRAEDAALVVELARKHEATLIVVGQSFSEAGVANAAGRRSGRFAEALRELTPLPVVLWDEALSTQDAVRDRILAGTRRKARRKSVDAAAAALILRSFLDAEADANRR